MSLKLIIHNTDVQYHLGKYLYIAYLVNRIVVSKILKPGTHLQHLYITQHRNITSFDKINIY